MISMPDHCNTVYEKEKPEEYAKLRKLALVNLRRKQKDDCMKDLGLIKLRGI